MKKKTAASLQLGFSIFTFSIASAFVVIDPLGSSLFQKLSWIPYLAICLTSFLRAKKSILILNARPQESIEFTASGNKRVQ